MNGNIIFKFGFFLTILSTLVIIVLTQCATHDEAAVTIKETPEPGQPQLETISGVISEAGITSYMYGSHILYSSDAVFHTEKETKTGMAAIASDMVDLNLYNDTQVTVEGYWRKDYPIEGGPPYFIVEQVVKSIPVE